MTNLQKREDIIKAKRKNNGFNDFLKDIASWYPVIFRNVKGYISRFPDTDRIKGVISYKDFEKSRELLCNYGIKYDFSNNFF